MADTKILSIDIDDSQFKAFAKLYEDYNSKLGKMPERWKAAARVINDSAGHNADAVKRITHAFKEAGDAQRAFAHATGVGSRGLEKMVALSESLHRHLFNSVRAMLRFGALGAVGLATGTVLGGDRLIRSGQQQVLQARGLNATTAQVTAFR